MADGACFNEQTPVTLKVCEKYVQNDKCFIVVKSETEAERGCVSDENGICDDDEMCIKDLESKMNNIPGTRDGRCYQCSTESVPPNLACNNDLTNEETCPVLLGRETECYYYNDGTKVIRGCLATVADDIKNDCPGANCKVTLGDLNNDQTDSIQCITCDSKTDLKCVEDLKDFERLPCAFRDEESNKCFLHVLAGKTFYICYFWFRYLNKRYSFFFYRWFCKAWVFHRISRRRFGRMFRCG